MNNATDGTAMTASFQLYSARNHGTWDEVFAMLARLGFTRVEGFGGNYDDPARTRALMDAHGMTMPSGHFFPIDRFEEDFVASIAAARTLGMDRLYCPAPGDDLRAGADAAAWTAFARRLETAAQRVNDAGLRFGWHNHHWEFLELPVGGTAMELLLEHAPSMEWEMDLAWVVRGGADPLAWIAAHGARITAAHVKDIAAQGQCADEDGWADLGHGTIDWAGCMTALRGVGVDLFVLEHDKPSDAERFARRSVETFRKL